METFDIAIIGGGPGGYVAAIKAAQLGFKTACIDKRGAFGGTCLYEGCIPSKALLDASYKYYHAQHDFADQGFLFDNLRLDLNTLMTRKNNIVQSLGQGIASLFKKNKVTAIKGTARFKDAHTLSIQHNDDISELTAKHFIIATGSRPITLPHIPVDERLIVSSTGALSFEAVPHKLLVIGGGYIGLEMASVWQRLGAQVTVVEMGNTLVPGMDKDIQKALPAMLKKQGIDIQLNAKVTAAHPQKNHVKVTLTHQDTEEERTFDKVLLAIGRTPYTDGLNLEAANVTLDERGFVKVNSNLQTAAPYIYAIGDCVPGPMLAHKAEEEGVRVVERLAGQKPHINYNLIPGVMYTHPEAAGVGATEQSLEKGAYKVGKFPMLANSRAKAIGQTEGFVKVITDIKTDRVVGVHILADQAGTMIAEAAMAMEFGATAEDIARTCHAHPTHNEALKEAALSAWQKAIHL